MTLIWTRIDQKLIHGQVAVGWVPHLKIETIVVSDADMADDDWSQKVMTMGVPKGVETLFTTHTHLPSLLTGADLVGKRVMLLFKTLEDFIKAAEWGLEAYELNLGNQAGRPGESDLKLSDSFFASSMELDGLAQMEKNGLKVVIQATPNSKPLKWPNK